MKNLPDTWKLTPLGRKTILFRALERLAAARFFNGNARDYRTLRESFPTEPDFGLVSF